MDNRHSGGQCSGPGDGKELGANNISGDCHTNDRDTDVKDLGEIFDTHVEAEFVDIDVDKTMATMTEEPYVHNVPTLIGGVGAAGVRDFYTNHFVGHVPPDTTTEQISRTVGENQVVEELIFSFTHTTPVDFMLPGVAPTGRRISVPLVVVMGFEGDKVSHEHIYWDQACVLVQAGLINPDDLPVAGAGEAAALVDQGVPKNQLLAR